MGPQYNFRDRSGTSPTRNATILLNLNVQHGAVNTPKIALPVLLFGTKVQVLPQPAKEVQTDSFFTFPGPVNYDMNRAHPAEAKNKQSGAYFLIERQRRAAGLHNGNQCISRPMSRYGLAELWTALTGTFAWSEC